MNLHTATVTVDKYGCVTVGFHCAGDDLAPCHNYPDCRCESWDDDHEHPAVLHERCWMFDWFDNDAAVYKGDDDCGDGMPTIARSGPIAVDFDIDYVAWDWSA